MRIEFKPFRLESILKRVREDHPIYQGKSIEITRSLLEAVRARLESCPLQSVPTLARKLTSSEMLCCLDILVTDKNGETAEKAAAAVRTGPRPLVLLEGWKKLIAQYPHDLLEETVRALIDALDVKQLVDAGVAPPWVSDWLENASLVGGVFTFFSDNRPYTTLDSYLQACRLDEAHGLHRSVWRQLLTRGKAEDLLAESGSRMVEEMVKFSTTRRDLTDGGRHYLNTVRSSKNWHEQILDTIAKAFGLPGDPEAAAAHEDSFWKGVDTSVKLEYHKWLLLRQISRFFEGERAEFWKPYAESELVKSVKEILNGDGLMLDFGTFGVVEFKEIGNAAYVYPRGVFRKYWMTANTLHTPPDFKNRNLTINLSQRRWYGRIFHSVGWQHKTGEILRDLLASR